MIYDDVVNAVGVVVSERGYDVEIVPSMELRDFLDSMSILEVIIILEEEGGYETKLIRVDTISTVQDLIDEVSKCDKRE
jgi:acyl carrier protein